jgi:hypothetical protein
MLADRISPALPPAPPPSLDTAADALLAALAAAHAAARVERVELPPAFRELVTWALRRRVQLATDRRTP